MSYIQKQALNCLSLLHVHVIPDLPRFFNLNRCYGRDDLFQLWDNFQIMERKGTVISTGCWYNPYFCHIFSDRFAPLHHNFFARIEVVPTPFYKVWEWPFKENDFYWHTTRNSSLLNFAVTLSSLLNTSTCLIKKHLPLIFYKLARSANLVVASKFGVTVYFRSC